MGTEQAFAKPNMEDSRVDIDPVSHSSAADETCSLWRCGNHTKDLGKVNPGTWEFLINLQHKHPI